MKKIQVILITLSFIVFSAIGLENKKAPNNCDKVKPYKALILENDPEKLTEYLHFPLDAVLIGSIDTFKYKGIFLKLWKTIFDEQLMEKVKNRDNCKLLEELKIDPETGKITSLIIDYDPEDARLSYASISSVKELNAFLSNFLTKYESKDISGLAPFFKYSFVVYEGETKILVENEKDFKRHSNLILTNKLLNLVNNALKYQEFNQHPMGLMLNERGDVWVQEYDDGLKLQIFDVRD